MPIQYQVFTSDDYTESMAKTMKADRKGLALDGINMISTDKETLEIFSEFEWYPDIILNDLLHVDRPVVDILIGHKPMTIELRSLKNMNLEDFSYFMEKFAQSICITIALPAFNFSAEHLEIMSKFKMCVEMSTRTISNQSNLDAQDRAAEENRQKQG